MTAPRDAVPDGAPQRAPRAGARPAQPSYRAVVAVLAVLAGLTLALLASRSGPPFVSPPRSGGSLPTLAPLPPASTTPAQTRDDPNQKQRSSWYRFIWLYLVAAAVVTFLGLLAIPMFVPTRPRLRVRLRFGRPPPGPAHPPRQPRAREALASAVQRALALLENGPVEDAIVTCWLGLEEAAARAGTRRQPAETSAELTERVLAAHHVTAGTLRRLAALYREARFSRHVLDEQVRAEARALFEQVRAELTAAAA